MITILFIFTTKTRKKNVVIAALGMLSTIATRLSIDAYGPISDNAVGIDEMAAISHRIRERISDNAVGIDEMAAISHRIRERTDALDAAGNTTAAIGKVLFSSFSFLPDGPNMARISPGSTMPVTPTKQKSTSSKFDKEKH
ncbi:hypothetical protein RYX36_002951 [Vicia faba]